MDGPVFITGAAGFIGSHVAERLLRDGREVRGLDNFDPFYDRSLKEANLAPLLSHPSFRFTEGDIRSRYLLDRWGGGETPSAVIHLAARAGVRPSVADPAAYADVNVTGTARVLEMCRKRGVPRLLFASTSSVYGGNRKVPFAESDPVDRPVSPYAATKKAGELLCHAHAHLHGTDVACLRFFTVYGPRQRPEMAVRKFTRALFDGTPLTLFGDGSSRRDYTYVDDIVDGVVGALSAPPGFRVYNLGGSATTSLSELVERLEGLTGKRAVRRSAPDQEGDVPVTYADVTLAGREIGYAPRVPLAEGLARFVGWYREACGPAGGGVP